VTGNYVRFAFCKTDETLEAAQEAFTRLGLCNRASVAIK
jgi:aspartate/methionine/tyrosine aminotransferase